MHRALIIVDVQNDFCPGGSLAVAGGDVVAERVSRWAEQHGDDYDLVVATMDWHPSPRRVAGFAHFSTEPDYRLTWPAHCVEGTKGASFHPSLALPDRTVVVRKGQHDAAYSGFEGRDDAGRSLLELLRERDIDAIDVAGLATDHCVRATALDAVHHGFEVRVLADLVAGVAPDTTADAVEEMRGAGISVG